MQAGRLNRRCTLQQPGTTTDELGQPIPGWTDVATVWASIVDVSGREYVAAGGMQNAAQTKVTIRKRSGITPAMRVVHGDTVFNIEAALEQGRDALLLMCSRSA